MHHWNVVSTKELGGIFLPEETDSYRPIAHSHILDATTTALQTCDYRILRHSLAISREGEEFFAILDLYTEVTETEKLVVGVRNSHNKKFAMGFCIGTRTCVCSNLCFSSDIVINNRHTKFGGDRYVDGITTAVSKLDIFKETQQRRIAELNAAAVSEEEAESLILRAAEQGMIGWQTLPKILAEWRSPSHEEHRLNSRYGLLQAFTQVLKERFDTQPRKAALETIRIQTFLAS